MSARGDDFGEALYDEETLAAIEAWSEAAGTGTHPGISGWRRTSVSGAVLGAALLGLGDALEGRRLRERPPIVVDDAGQPHDPDALVDLDFDPASPAGTVAHLRTGAEPHAAPDSEQRGGLIGGRGEGGDGPRSAPDREQGAELGGGCGEGGDDPVE